MKTKSAILSLLAGIALLTPRAGLAQGIGLQVGDTADGREPGQLEIAPGMVFGDGLSFYGVRESYTVLEELRVFLDLGALNADNSDLDFAGQIGALACLPSEDYICNLAARAALYYVNGDEEDVFGGSLMLLSSDESLLDDLYLYGGLGMDIGNRSPDDGSGSRTEVNPAITLGVLYHFTASVSAYLEVSHVDGGFIGTGIRLR